MKHCNNQLISISISGRELILKSSLYFYSYVCFWNLDIINLRVTVLLAILAMYGVALSILKSTIIISVVFFKLFTSLFAIECIREIRDHRAIDKMLFEITIYIYFCYDKCCQFSFRRTTVYQERRLHLEILIWQLHCTKYILCE